MFSVNVSLLQELESVLLQLESVYKKQILLQLLLLLVDD